MSTLGEMLWRGDLLGLSWLLTGERMLLEDGVCVFREATRKNVFGVVVLTAGVVVVLTADVVVVLTTGVDVLTVGVVFPFVCLDDDGDEAMRGDDDEEETLTPLVFDITGSDTAERMRRKSQRKLTSIECQWRGRAVAGRGYLIEI